MTKIMPLENSNLHVYFMEELSGSMKKMPGISMKNML